MVQVVKSCSTRMMVLMCSFIIGVSWECWAIRIGILHHAGNLFITRATPPLNRSYPTAHREFPTIGCVLRSTLPLQMVEISSTLTPRTLVQGGVAVNVDPSITVPYVLLQVMITFPENLNVLLQHSNCVYVIGSDFISFFNTEFR